MKLTARGVAGLEAENGSAQTEYWDELVPGLALRVGSGGTKSFTVRYRANGRNRRMTIGRYPHLSLADARDKARGILADAQGGEDPAQERRVRRSKDVTFGALAAEVLEAKAPPKTRQATHDEYTRIVETELLPVWKDRPASSITRRDVVELVERVARRAPVMGNRVLAITKVIFNAGLKRGFPTLEANPAHMMDPPAEEDGRDRYLDRSEIGKVWAALEWESPVMKALFRLALLTGQRMGSCCALRWSDLDDADVWRIPAAQFKGKRDHLVPLSPEALATLEELRQLTGADEYAFPGRGDGKNPHVNNYHNAARRIRERAKIPHWTPHDFRTTLRTHATRAERPDHAKDPAGLGVAPHVADAVLGHKEASLGFDRYTAEPERYLLSEKREALKRWGAFVAKAASC